MSPERGSVEWEYPDHVERLREEEPSLADESGRFTGITGVLDWMERRELSRSMVDIIGQDEFHYDFLINLEPGGRWISFGVT